MKFRALKECPQGQMPGDIFEAEEDAGAVLESVHAAERVSDDELKTTNWTDATKAEKADEPPAHASRRRYKRTDMESES